MVKIRAMNSTLIILADEEMSCGKIKLVHNDKFISLPGRSPGRAVVLPPVSALASALAKILTLKFFM